jgi:hypothetical protein
LPVKDEATQADGSAAEEVNDASEAGRRWSLRGGPKEVQHAGTDEDNLVGKVSKEILHTLTFLRGEEMIVAGNGQRRGRWRGRRRRFMHRVVEFHSNSCANSCGRP